MSNGMAEVLRLNKYNRAALSRILPVGSHSPLSEAAFSGAPDPRDVFALTIPPSCLPPNTKTYGDIFAKSNRHINSTQAFVNMLGMISMAITRPATGFGSQAQPETDRRGAVTIAPDTLTFTHNDRTFPRTAQYMEELRSNGGQLCGLRLWIFVVDPELDLAVSLADVARTNNLIYNSARQKRRPVDPRRPPAETVNRRDRYISHARATSEADVVTMMGTIVSVGLDSVNVREHPQRRRVAGQLRSALVREQTIQSQSSPASPQSVFSPALALIFHSNEVCDLQRDLTGYFIISGAGSEEGHHRQGEEADVPAGIASSHGGIDAANVDDEDDGDGFEPGELEALAGISTYNELGGDDPMAMDGDGDDDNDGATAAVGSGGGDGEFGDVALALLDGSVQAKFSSFPHPERVQSIPSEFFGEALLNVPLPQCYVEPGEDEDEDEDASADNERPSLALMFRLLSSDLERWEESLDEERLSFIRSEYANHVSPYYDESSPHYFELDEEALAYDKEAQEVAIYKIYRAAKRIQDDWRTNDVIPEIRSKIQNSRPLQIQLEPTQRRLNADGRLEMVYNDRERPLRETVTMEAMTLHDIEFFSRGDDILGQRIDNNAALNEIIREYAPNSDEFYREVRSWRMAAAERFYKIAMDSDNVSDAWKKQREWFKRLPPNKQWARHELSHPDLSFYANTMLLQVQRYNQIYNGASTQSLYLLMQRIVIGTPMYKWDLRPNLLVYGRGGDGKSYPLTACEAMCAPGLVKCYSHITEKAFSVNKPYSDETFCMHEAPGFMLGVDDHGKEVPSNPILKDRLIRQRSGTMAFGTSESGERVRLEQEVMVMGNAILLTNDIIPSDKKALTQRFILKAVHHTKRKGFQKGDYANLSAEEVAQSINTDQVHASRLFSFYCGLVFQMAKANVIPDPSTDGASKLLRQILNKFTERTRIDSEDARKRTKVVDIMAITTVMNAVSVGLFSRLSDDYRYETLSDGSSQPRPFDISAIIDHVMPRLYATDEVLMDTINIMDFLFEPHVHYDVLQTVVARLNSNVHLGDALTMADVNFRYIHNPRYSRNQSRRFHHQRQHTTTALARLNQGAGGRPQTIGTVHTATHETGDGSGGGGGFEEPEHEIDPRYVTVSANGMSQILSIIAEAAEDRPSENEVLRVLKMLNQTQRECHPAYLVPVEGAGGRGPHIQDASSYAGDDDDDDDESNERAIEDANVSESESGPMYPAPVGARHLMEGVQQQQHGALTPAGPRRPANSQVDIYENKRFRLVIDTAAKPTSEFIVLFDSDPRHRDGKKRVVSVMVEALKDDTFRDALLKATQDVLSCRNQPKSGKNYFTPKDYEHRLPNGAREKMPQYKQIVHVPHRDQPMRFMHVPVGTEDSNAALANCTNDGGGTEAMMQTILQNNLYTELDRHTSINAHFLFSHLRACDMSLENMERYLPEWADKEIYERTMAIHTSCPSRYTFTRGYPESVARKEVTKRMVSEAIRSNPNDERGKIFRLKSRRVDELSHLSPAIAGIPGITIDPGDQKIVISPSVSRDVRKSIETMQKNFATALNGVTKFRTDYERLRIKQLGAQPRQIETNARQVFCDSKADSFSQFLALQEQQQQQQEEPEPLLLPSSRSSDIATPTPALHTASQSPRVSRKRKRKRERQREKQKKREREGVDVKHKRHGKKAKHIHSSSSLQRPNAHLID